MKKAKQLGMNPSTASNRLVKDILYKLIVETNQNLCHQCNEPMTREDFSIEHKIAWLDSESPLELYFDLNNIAFSHHKCNVGARRQHNPAICGTQVKYQGGCRCEECRNANATEARSRYDPEQRSKRYKITGW